MTGRLWAALLRRSLLRAYAAAGKEPPPEARQDVPAEPKKEYMTAERWQAVIDSGAGNMPPR